MLYMLRTETDCVFYVHIRDAGCVFVCFMCIEERQSMCLCVCLCFGCIEKRQCVFICFMCIEERQIVFLCVLCS
jgi:hypothetical protein